MAKLDTVLYFKYSFEAVTQVHDWLLANAYDDNWETEFIFETSIIDAKLAVSIRDPDVALMMRIALSELYVGMK